MPGKRGIRRTPRTMQREQVDARAHSHTQALSLTPFSTHSYLWADCGALVSMRSATLTLRAASLSLSLFRAACLCICAHVLVCMQQCARTCHTMCSHSTQMYAVRGNSVAAHRFCHCERCSEAVTTTPVGLCVSLTAVSTLFCRNMRANRQRPVISPEQIRGNLEEASLAWCCPPGPPAR